MRLELPRWWSRRGCPGREEREGKRRSVPIGVDAGRKNKKSHYLFDRQTSGLRKPKSESSDQDVDSRSSGDGHSIERRGRKGPSRSASTSPSSQERQNSPVVSQSHRKDLGAVYPGDWPPREAVLERARAEGGEVNG